MLQRALPLVPTSGGEEASARVDLASDTVSVFVTARDTFGATPTSCIELLQIRPLLVGAAWKVLDVLIETALDEAGIAPAKSSKWWTIQEKVAHANRAAGRPAMMSAQAWTSLTITYAQTEQLRHSLVHRRAHTDSSHALVGVDEAGRLLRALSADEQEALVRAALRASEIVAASQHDERVEADLIRQLGILSGIHGQQLPTVTLRESLPVIAVVLDPENPTSHRYPLDVPRVWRRQPFGQVMHADLVVEFRDRPGQTLRGRLERAPLETVVIDLAQPPGWLN